MKQNKSTSTSERTNVRNDMWRKKVDNNLFRYHETTIPRWIASKWNLEKYFPDKNGLLKKSDKNSQTEINFKNRIYAGNIRCTFPKGRANKVHMLSFSEELGDELRNVFLMSYMRDIEAALRKNVGDLEKEIPFWEFLDIEFDPNSKQFIFTDHYKHEPMFPELFKRLSGSPSLKVVQDEIFGKGEFRIHKQDWKIKEDLDSELGATNVIYTLLDKKNKLIYIGEAKDLRKRLKQRYPSIPNWTHYRYDRLPESVNNKNRVALERMVIRSAASLLGNKSDIDTADISKFKLANDKIDK